MQAISGSGYDLHLFYRRGIGAAGSPGMAQLHIEKEAGVDEQQEDGGGEQEGGYGEVHIELVDAGCQYRIDCGGSAGKDHQGPQQHLIGEKLLDDEVGSRRQDDEPQGNQIQDAAVVLPGPLEIHQIAHGQQRGPGADVDKGIEKGAEEFRAGHRRGLQHHADQHAQHTELVPGEEQAFEFPDIFFAGFFCKIYSFPVI